MHRRARARARERDGVCASYLGTCWLSPETRVYLIVITYKLEDQRVNLFLRLPWRRRDQAEFSPLAPPRIARPSWRRVTATIVYTCASPVLHGGIETAIKASRAPLRSSDRGFLSPLLADDGGQGFRTKVYDPAV
jgi:hypothetical protein